MKYSIVVPQVFYDLIARILPGLVFLLVVFLGFPDLSRYLQPLGVPGANNLIDALGQGVGYATLSYFLGWLFFAFTCGSKRDAQREKYVRGGDPASLNAAFQWIRLSHPAAGFRIAKLRAEARMFEATRTAMLATIALSLFYLLLLPLMDVTAQVSWRRGLTVIVLAAISALGFRKCEKRAWDNYWANIDSIYKILNGQENRVMPLRGSKDDTE